MFLLFTGPCQSSLLENCSGFIPKTSMTFIRNTVKPVTYHVCTFFFLITGPILSYFSWQPYQDGNAPGFGAAYQGKSGPKRKGW